MSLEKRVWETLSAVDVSKFVEKKGGLDYLPWSDAWCILMNHWPKSYYREDHKVMPDGSVMCSITVTIWEGDEMVQRHVWLPVMDYKNQAIKNPSARDLSDNYMRCLVKCLAMFGLGLNLYTGMSEPVNQLKATSEQLETIKELLERTEADTDKFTKVFGDLNDMSESKAKKAIELLYKKLEQNDEAA
jgi:hypothetical protein